VAIRLVPALAKFCGVVIQAELERALYKRSFRDAGVPFVGAAR
jgi:hypothetical protein